MGNEWDTHSDNFNRLKNKLLPPVDRAVSALLADLDDRGMLGDTLVVLVSEMGRTPTINKNRGRDHWGKAYSLMLAGGGLTAGQLLGSSDRHGAAPHDRRVHLCDVLATIYQQLGINPNLTIEDNQGRPAGILPFGEPVHELVLG